MRRYASRTDDNHRAIVSALRAAGATVQSLAATGAGCPDLLVGYRRAAYLLEVKRHGSEHAKAKPGGKGKSSQTATRQLEWRQRWRGPEVVTVRSPEEALAAIGATWLPVYSETGIEAEALPS